MNWPDDFVNKLIQGDCLDVMEHIPDDSIDLVLTDPPYFLPATHYQTRRNFSRNFCDLGVMEHFFKDVFGQLARVTKPTGAMYIFCNCDSYPLFYYHLYPVVRQLRDLVWDKMSSFLGYTWRHQHELILFAQMTDSPSIRTGDGDIIKCRTVAVDDRQHAAQKPVPLLEKPIEKSTEEDMIVLDPFAGVCSTAVACINTNRRYVCIELSPEYCKCAVDYIGCESRQMRLRLQTDSTIEEKGGNYVQ